MVWFKENKKWIVCICVGCLFIIVALFFFFSVQKEEKSETNNILENEVRADSNKKEEKRKEAKVTKIVVDVKGEVKRPGVYEMLSGDRVHQVLEKAGGITDQADKTQVNLAALLQDGMVVYIPKTGEQNSLPTNGTTTHKNDGSDSEPIVNINTASSEELQTISGIGPSKAEAIITYREENGLFQTIEDIKNVSGIGEKSFEKIKSSITVK